MHMVQLHLVEERHLAGYRMAQYAPAALADAQVVFPRPFAGGTRVAAAFFHNRSIFRSKETLPAHVQTFAKIPDVGEPFFGERLPHFGVETVVDFAAIHN